MTIYTLAEFATPPHKNKYLLVIPNRCSRLVQPVSLRAITAEAVANATAPHRNLAYGALRRLMFENKKYFISRFSQHVRKILGIEDAFTTTYIPQTNFQVKIYPTGWDVYICIGKFGYRSQIRRIANCTPFKLVLLQPAHAIVMQSDPKDV